MKCYNCGADLTDDTKFCSYCGVKIEKKSSEPSQLQEPTNYSEAPHESPIGEPPFNNTTTKASFGDNIKGKLSGFWNGLDLFCKVATIAIVVVAILLIVSILAKRGLAIFFSVLQLVGIIAALLMHKGTIKLERKLKWLKYLVLVFAILFTALNVMSYSWGRVNKPSNTPVQNPTDYQTPNTTAMPDVKTTAATPYSLEDCIGKDYSSVKSDFLAAGFEQIKIEKVEDVQSADSDLVDTIASVSIGGKTVFAQGQEFDKDDEVVILYHAFAKYSVVIHVDFIPNIIFSKYDVNLLVNGIDKGTLAHGEDKDFTFSLEPGDYTLTFESADSSSTKGEVSLTVDCDLDASYKISCYSDKVSVEELYVDRLTELADGKVKLDASASEYNYKNYTEVTAALETLGFTDIKYEILYDIVFGWTEEGEVKSVSIAGDKDFTRGDVFDKDAEIIITYHMPEGDDPTKETEVSTETTAPPPTTTTIASSPTIPPETSEISGVILPKSDSKLGKDFDFEDSKTVYYINVDGTKNVPKLANWGTAFVTDGVAAYLDYLQGLGYTITITSTDYREPYSGFHRYETDFEVEGPEISWTINLNIEDEKYVEYDLYINLP